MVFARGAVGCFVSWWCVGAFCLNDCSVLGLCLFLDGLGVLR